MVNLKESGFDVKRDSFSQNLAEANEFFATTYKTNVIGSDFASVITNENLYSQYVARLTEGFRDDKMASQVETLLENAREEILSETALSGIQPFHSLTVPMLVKLWARLTLTQAIPTEPTKTPAFTVPYVKPFMLDVDGNRIELPEGINNIPEKAIGLVKLKEAVTLTSGKTTNYDLFTGVTKKRDGIDEIDRNFNVVSIKYPDAKGEEVALDRNSITAGSTRVDDKGNIFFKVKYEDKTVTTTIHEDSVFGHVDFTTGKLDLLSTKGNATEAKIRGYVSSEQHTTSIQVQLEIARKDIQVGTAAHIEGQIPVESAQDLRAMYDVDGASMITEIMTNVNAQKVDLDILEFLEKTHQSSGAQFTKTFSVYPSSQYAMDPDQWLKGLRRTIDYVATSIKNQFKSYDSYFVIVGNPLDVDLIPNVEWTFRNIDGELNGIDVQYSLGAIRGSNHYRVVASDLIPQGELTILGVPTRNDYKSVVFYPYAFNVTDKYLNTRNAAVPSIMMTRRYTLEEFQPMIGKVKVLHNDGTLYGTPKWNS